MTTMPTRRLGGLQVSAIGLGEMPMSLAGRPDEARSVRTIHAALDAGVTLIDTADAYCLDSTEMGHGERLVAKALAELKEAGKVRLVGLSNVSVDQIRQARQLVQVASVQNEFSPRFRRSEGELAFCAAERIAFLPWSPLGGIGRGRDLGGRHRAFAEVAQAHAVSPQQVALAWQLAKAPVVVPIPGSSRPETIVDSAAATGLCLSDDELARLDRV